TARSSPPAHRRRFAPMPPCGPPTWGTNENRARPCRPPAGTREASMTAPLLAVEGLAAGYGPSKVLFGIDFHVDAGEVVTLMGRNGMGKSTTIKCLSGMHGA